MGQVITPDGRVIFVPDDIGFAPPNDGGLMMDGGGPAPGFAPPGLAPMGSPPPMQPQDPYGSPLPTAVLDRIGVPRSEPYDATAAPNLASAGIGGAAGGARVAGDVKYQGKLRKQEAQQAAYNASPEGQINASVRGQQAAMDEQAGIATKAGDLAAQEAEAAQGVIDDRNVALQTERGAAEAEAKARAEGLAEHTAAYEKAIDAEANHKIDDNRKWNNTDTPMKILAGIGVALSIVGDSIAKRQGPNLAMQIIQEAIKDDIASQVRDREQLGKTVDRRRNSLDGYRQITGDMREAANLKIAEEYKRAADQIEATGAKYASPKAKLAAMSNAATLRMEAQRLVGSAAEGKFNRQLQTGAQAIQRSQVGVSWFNAKEGKRQFDKNLDLNNRQLLVEAAKLDAAGNVAGAKAARAEAATNNELGMLAPAVVKVAVNPTTGQSEPVLKDDGTPEINQGSMLINADGGVWNAPDKETRRELGKKRAAAEDVARMIDEVLAIRDDVGGEAGALNSDASQRLKVLQNQIIVRVKSGTEGMSSDEDMKKLAEAVGAGEVSSFRARAAGLEEGRKRTVDQLNVAMKYQGNYSGNAIDIASTRAKGARDTAADAEFKATAAPAPVNVMTGDPGTVLGTDPTDKYNPYSKRLPTSVLETIKKQAFQVTDGKTEQDKIRARNFLGNLATESTDADVRRIAAQALVDALQSSSRSTDNPGSPTTARDTLSGTAANAPIRPPQPPRQSTGEGGAGGAR